MSRPDLHDPALVAERGAAGDGGALADVQGRLLLPLLLQVLHCTALYCTVLNCTVLYYYLFYSSAWFFEDKYHVRVAKAWDYILQIYYSLDTFIVFQDC